MGHWVDNKRQILESALTALERIGTQRPTAYHLEREGRNHYGHPVMFPPSPQTQSKARYDAINARIDAVEAAEKALRAEIVYRLTPSTDKTTELV